VKNQTCGVALGWLGETDIGLSDAVRAQRVYPLRTISVSPNQPSLSTPNNTSKKTNHIIRAVTTTTTTATITIIATAEQAGADPHHSIDHFTNRAP
jgi:hypothetical protein